MIIVPPSRNLDTGAGSTPLDTIDLLLKRRSVLANNMTGPGPTPDQLDTILRAGARVPDHGKLAPWRFIVFEGEARASFGEVLAQAFRAANPDAAEARVEAEQDRFTRAPVVVAVVSKVMAHPKIPEWEQVLSAGAVCQTMLVAAAAMGLAGQWITEWYAYDDDVVRALDLADGEKIAGYLYFGTAREAPDERARPDLDTIVTRWQPSA